MKINWKRRFAWSLCLALLLSLALALGPSPAAADDGAKNVLRTADAALYELSENACIVDSAGSCVFSMAQAVARVATSALQGISKVGTILCPAEALVTNPKTNSCTVTATGQDYVSFLNGLGWVNGSFDVVVQLDNPVDSPELPVLVGTFEGTINFTPAFSGIPLGYVTGTLTVTQSPLNPTLVGLAVPFTGVFRQPFAISEKGDKKEAGRGEDAFYLLDNGKTQRVKQDERAAGWPTVRFEITFAHP